MNLINKLRNNKKKIFLLFLFLIFFWVWKDYNMISQLSSLFETKKKFH